MTTTTTKRSTRRLLGPTPDERRKIFGFLMWVYEINLPENLDSITLITREHKEVLALIAEQVNKCITEHEEPLRFTIKEWVRAFYDQYYPDSEASEASKIERIADACAGLTRKGGHVYTLPRGWRAEKSNVAARGVWYLSRVDGGKKSGKKKKKD